LPSEDKSAAEFLHATDISRLATHADGASSSSASSPPLFGRDAGGDGIGKLVGDGGGARGGTSTSGGSGGSTGGGT